MTKLYLSGPMTGLPELNFPAFHAAAAQLRDRGFVVINPAEIHQDDPSKWLACMWTDIAVMAAERPQGVATLNGWAHSRGGRAEVQLFWNLHLPAWPVQTWLQMGPRQRHSQPTPATTHPATA